MITIYGQANCIFCERAKRLAEDYNLKYAYQDVGYPDVRAEFRHKFPSAKTVPQIEWDGRYIGGFVDFAEEVESTVGGYGEGQC